MRKPCIVILLLMLLPNSLWAVDNKLSSKPAVQASEYEERQQLIERMSAVTGIPWIYLAAVDQYERTITIANKKTRVPRQGLTAIQYPEEQWAGPLNPDKNETSPQTIALFGGIGMDGNADGIADRNNDEDVLYTVAKHLQKHGTSIEDFRIAVWELYHNSRAVDRIIQFANIYAAFNTLELEQHAFPVPLRSNYTYRGTWGARRGWGGLRIHEGTDIFAGYGVPVRSTCYGIVEIKGWNRYGGWRIGIRSINNVYHYYAHLSGFNKEVAIRNRVVKPGDVIGWVGSSGYGNPGTSGKFPPHLHYGLYRDGGLTDWSFDPYPNLLRWEREEAKRRRSG